VVRLRCICVRRLDKCRALILELLWALETSPKLLMLLFRVSTLGCEGMNGCDDADPDLDRGLYFVGELDMDIVVFGELEK
jgi:hypothetical protein